MTSARQTPYFDDAERAALALAEAATPTADRGEAVPDEIRDAVDGHFDEGGFAALTVMIATTGLANRLNIANRVQAPQAW